MAAKDGIGKASAAAAAARRNRYVRRLIEDDEVRHSLLAAYAAARKAYGRMGNGKPASRALLQDRKLQRELSEAVSALRDASSALNAKPKRRRRKGGLARKAMFVLVAAALALALSESLRSKLLDLLFGAEEEFEYSSSTAPSQPASSPEGASAAAS